MKRTQFRGLLRSSVAVLCAALLIPTGPLSHAQSPPPPGSADDQAPPIPDDQLDSLVAPIALYPDPILGQVLVASTYPLEIIQLQQWLARNKGLKDKALVDAVSKQPWDPSIQAMAVLPNVVKRLSDDIQWTTDLGNAFLAQQSDVMDAVQRMRKKAQDKGNLKSTEQQTVETKVVESKTVIVVEPASPQVMYVPSYDPVVVYGAPAYPYPPIYYPPAGYYAAGMAVSFGVGMALGAAASGGWGYGCGWGGSGNNDVNINNNNNFNRNNINNSGNRGNANNGKWKHNPQHRGGAPYGNRATANKYGGNARGDSLSSRQTGARQQTSRQGQQGGRQSQQMARGGQGQGGNRPSSPGGGSAGDRGGASGRDVGGSRSAGGADRAGSRNVSGGGGSRSGGFGGGGGYSGSSARASSSRGSSSMGGGGSRGGGSYGGGSRGGRGGGGGGGRGGGGGGRRR